MADYYPAELTQKSRRLYQTLRAWATARPDVAVIGGWAVVELVEPGADIPSRDVDLVFRTEDAARDFLTNCPGWHLRKEIDKVDNRLIFALEEDTTGTIVVDVFTTEGWGREAFDTRAMVPIKKIPWTGLVPPLQWLLREKLETVSNRMGRDAYDKQEKDLLDIHRLVFHNREAVPPANLLAATTRGARREADGDRIQRAIRRHPAFAEDYRKIGQWLEAPSFGVG